ncbi:DUF2785 domain-containing protein [Actinacidiphila paucisporea]|uniref:DUF2785 domain-containing protein n=1 Tax=Actinacidiphila paucisporea TaxID=310782 RepID=A0A1M7N244_9ACTN|nr:DUF2785 domain-containing protein [Actinacidiphila paucisporea]SHM97003.1 Protein of unknown function [Actinacidiphila paucisporea]
MHTSPVDWTAVAAENFAFPAGVGARRIGDELAGMLVSPDPRVRDEYAYTAAAGWIRGGYLDEVLVAMGDAAAERFVHPEVQARTFAPLVLTCVLDRGRQVPGAVPEAAVLRWYADFAAWYPHERDTRGWDDAMGWLHAVAHGADAAASFAAALPDHRTELLELCAQRMTAKGGDYRYVQVEDARLAAAITRILLAPGLTAGQATGWLDIVTAAFADGGPGAVPAWAFNTFATLQSLHLHLNRGLAEGGVPPHADEVAGRLVEILRLPYRWLG